MDKIFEEMVERWPSAIVARTEISAFTGGLMNEKYQANLDSQGDGPEGSFRNGRKVVYPVIPYVQWLARRSSAITRKGRA